MKIAIASGKGGTGKTTVATNLAFALSGESIKTAYVDCDVEEPNGHLFLKPSIQSRKPVELAVPSVDMETCSLCGLCGQICRYSAILCLGNQVLVFPDMCHSCGGCWQVCPENAIEKKPRVLGYIESGTSNSLLFAHGILNVGEALCTPVLRELKRNTPEADVTIFDAPPGTSCPVIETIRDCDYVLLVAEPTPFGLNDFMLAVEVVKKLNLPFGAIINRADLGYEELNKFCYKQQIPVLTAIPDDRRIAEAYSRGVMLSQAIPEYLNTFVQLYEYIESQLNLSEVRTA